MAISPIDIATQGLLNSPLSVAAVRGRLHIHTDRGGSSDPAKFATVDPVLRSKLLREDDEILAIILTTVEVIDP